MNCSAKVKPHYNSLWETNLKDIIPKGPKMCIDSHFWPVISGMGNWLASLTFGVSMLMQRTLKFIWKWSKKKTTAVQEWCNKFWLKWTYFDDVLFKSPMTMLCTTIYLHNTAYLHKYEKILKKKVCLLA